MSTDKKKAVVIKEVKESTKEKGLGRTRIEIFYVDGKDTFRYAFSYYPNCPISKRELIDIEIEGRKNRSETASKYAKVPTLRKIEA